MKQFILFTISITLLLSGCDKRKPTTFMGNSYGNEPLVARPCSLLKISSLGWRDTTFNTANFIKSAVTNPANKEEIIYNAAGNIYNYNRRTFQKQLIATGMDNLFLQINQLGEVVYLSNGNYVCKVKANGDSLKVYDVSLSEPFWDYTGRFIYFTDGRGYITKLRATTGVIISKVLETLPRPLCYSKTADKMLKFDLPAKKLYFKDVVTGAETIVLTNFNLDCQSVSTDENDNVYFYNRGSLFKVNTAIKKLDTLYTKCSNTSIGNTNYMADTYVYSPYVAPNTGILNFVSHQIMPVNDRMGYTVSAPVEVNLTTKQVTRIQVKP